MDSVQFQGSATSTPFAPERAYDPTGAMQQQLDKRLQWMREDQTMIIQDRNAYASALERQQRTAQTLRNNNVEALAGLSKTLTDTVLQVKKQQDEYSYEEGFNQYWTGRGDPKTIEKYQQELDKHSAVANETNKVAAKLANEGEDPFVVGKLRDLTGQKKIGFATALAQDKATGYGAWLSEKIKTDSETQIDLGGGRVITPVDAQKDPALLQAVAAWGRVQYLKESGLYGQNYGLLNKFFIPRAVELEKQVISGVTKQIVIERGDEETQSTISDLITNLGDAGSSIQAWNRTNIRLASVVNPETGELFGPRGAREFLAKQIGLQLQTGKESKISKDVIDWIMTGGDLDGKDTWGHRFPNLFAGFKDLAADAERADINREEAAIRVDADQFAKDTLTRLEAEGGWSDAGRQEYMASWRDKFGLIPLPEALGNYPTSEGLADREIEKTLIAKEADGIPIFPNDLAGLSNSKRVEWNKKLKKYEDDVLKNPVVVSHFAELDLMIKESFQVNAIKGGVSALNPTYEAGKRVARNMYLTQYKRLSAIKEPDDARQGALEYVASELRRGRGSKGKDGKVTQEPSGLFQIIPNNPNSGFVNLYPGSPSLVDSAKAAQRWASLGKMVNASPKWIMNPNLLVKEDFDQIEKMRKDPTALPPPSVLRLESIAHERGAKNISAWDIIDRQLEIKGLPTLTRPPAAKVIEGLPASIRQLFISYPSPARTSRGFASMPWKIEKIPNGWGKWVEDAAKQNGLEPALLAGLLMQESRWDPKVPSPTKENGGYIGLAQMGLAAASEVGVTDRTDPKQSIFGGAKYLRKMMDMFGNDLTMALRAYNYGPGATQRDPQGKGSREAREYPDLVMAHAASYRGGGYAQQELLHPAVVRLNQKIITSGMSSNRDGRPHNGVDTGVNQGSPLSFSQNAKLVDSGFDDGGWGNFMKFQLADGRQVLFGHLSQIPKGFKNGMKIPAGKNVALSGGNPGTEGAGRSTAEHLHTEEWDAMGNRVDPSRPGGAHEFINVPR